MTAPALDGELDLLAWVDGEVDVDGRRWAYRELGEGSPVIVLDPPGDAVPPDAPTALTTLAQSRRLIAPRLPAADPRDVARELGALLSALGLTGCGVIARGATAAVALWLAVDQRDLVGHLVLESPAGDANGTSAVGDESGVGAVDDVLQSVLPDLEVPTLVLLGQLTRAASPAQTAAVKRLPASTIGIVYDAGADIRGDRPTAYAAAVGDYLDRGQAFVVSRKSTVINA